MLKESKTVQERTQRTKVFKTTLKPNKLINKSSIYITNDVIEIDDLIDSELTKTPVKSGKGNFCKKDEAKHNYASSATMLKNPDMIMIPNKVKRLIEKHLPKPMLDMIHGGEKNAENREVAVELCFLFLSQLSSSYRNIKNGSNPHGWKDLRAEYLRQLLWIDEKTYQNVIHALEYSYMDGPIIEWINHMAGLHSRKYRLGLAFRGKGFSAYDLKTDSVRELSKKSCERKFKIADNNIICRNLLLFYNTITLPTIEEIEEEARRLIKEGYQNKKGKRLIFRNKKGNKYFLDLANLSFVEDAVKIFKYLTENGLIIPRPGNDKSGGRIVDSLVLMPSWIRKLIKINGQPIKEADYSCLHPNIAMFLYGGNAQNLQHTDLCIDLGVDEIIVKKEHLSFLNKEIWQMKQSPLFNYYQKHEPIMLNAIIKEKNGSEYGYKITSRRLFAKEVEIMTEVVLRLNEEGIFVGYIYDALFFDPQYSEKVVETMNEVAAEFSVFTTAKLEHKIS